MKIFIVRKPFSTGDSDVVVVDLSYLGVKKANETHFTPRAQRQNIR